MLSRVLVSLLLVLGLMASVGQYQAWARAAAQKYGIPPGLFLAQIGAESSWNPGAVSPAGARGIAQFMPGTAKAVGVNLYDEDPRDDLLGAAKHMAAMRRNLGSWELALAGYNAGAGAVQKYGGIPPYDETQKYVRKIMGQASNTSPGVAAVGLNATPGGPEWSARQMSPKLKKKIMQLASGPLKANDPKRWKLFNQALRQGTSERKAYQQASRVMDSGHQHDEGFSVPAADGGYGWAKQLAEKYGLALASTYRSPERNAAVGGSQTSAHMTQGAAADFSGSPTAMMNLAKWAVSTGRFREVFYDPLGKYWDNNKINPGGIGGHSDHVHITR